MKYNLMSISVMLGVFLFVGMWFVVSSGTDATDFDYKKEQAQMQRIFEEEGSEQAYRYFQTSYENLGQEVQGSLHLLAHWVGERLYEYDGMDGLYLCDESYIFGCFHGFFARSFADNGLEMLEMADDICSSRLSNDESDKCFHGIGHGLLFVQGGYTPLSLRHSLNICNQMSVEKGKSECRVGLFMEYNNRMVDAASSGMIIPREFVEEDRHVPCSEIAVVFQNECYIEQVTWWARALEDGVDFATMGNWCEEIEYKEPQNSCFRGVAEVIWELQDSDVEDLYQQCQLMPYPNRVNDCLRNGAILTNIHHQDSTRARKICAMIDVEHEVDRCLSLL